MSSEVVEKSNLGAHDDSQHPQWLAENLEEVDQSVKTILNLIKESGFSPGQKDDSYEKKPELIAHVEGLYSMYRSLAEQYDHLTEEVKAQSQNTVAQKLGPNKIETQVVGFSLSPSSGHGSSDFSDKGGSEISSSASDSESESFYSVADKSSGLRVNLPENVAYSTLLRRVTRYEEELKDANRKLCFSDKEIAKLKDELEKLRGVSFLVDELQDELELARREITTRDGDLETEKSVVLKLQEEVSEFQAMIETENRLISELKERILEHEDDAYEREQEIIKMNIALFDTQRISTIEKAKLNCDISIMSEQLTLLKARAEEADMQNEYLESETRKFEAEKIKMESMYKDEHTRWSGEIEKLKDDISERGKVVEAVNKDFDELKVKYDMLVAEKDGLIAKIQTLNAEMSSQNKVIRQLELKLCSEVTKHMDLMGRSDRTDKLVDELRVRVEELEREVEKQRVALSELCEEKREAIRQLCFSIEHYRNDYQELKKTVVGHRQAAVLAS